MNKRLKWEASKWFITLILFAALSCFFKYFIVGLVSAFLSFFCLWLSFTPRKKKRGKGKTTQKAATKTRNGAKSSGNGQIASLTRSEALQVRDLETLSGEAFEQLLKYYFEDEGYKVLYTLKGGGSQ